MSLVRTARRLARALVLPLAFAAPWVQAREPIRIGTLFAVTDPACFLGDSELKTLEMMVERINADGGVLGRKLQRVSYGSAGDTEKARSFVKQLIEQDRVDVIVGGSSTGATMAAVPLVEAARGTDKAKVRDAIEATKGCVGTGRVVDSSATDHMGLDLSTFRMLEVKSGNGPLVN